MTTYTNITNALVAVGARPFATTIQALRDNPLAIQEGDPSAPKIADAALSTTVTSAGQSWVRNRLTTASIIATVSSNVGVVGSYAMCRQQAAAGGGGGVVAGGTIAGSSLAYADAAGNSSATPSGTWRAMGFSNGIGSVTLWLRIS